MHYSERHKAIFSAIGASVLMVGTTFLSQEIYSTHSKTSTAGLIAFYLSNKYTLAAFLTLPIALLMSPGNRWFPLIGFGAGFLATLPLAIIAALVLLLMGPGVRFNDVAVWAVSEIALYAAFFIQLRVGYGINLKRSPITSDTDRQT